MRSLHEFLAIAAAKPYNSVFLYKLVGVCTLESFSQANVGLVYWELVGMRIAGRKKAWHFPPGSPLA